nr:hypothetical protein [Tanacetum cinerariifolium]
MSGKMARKPYTHQVKRAKDLLRLIQTDVCGPFKIMSRQGASYFVTFTDDFSRYGYVYLLKHKHEVFETFKVFQKEVENQLSKTIKSLRSAREGEYMSQEFLDHLKDHEIIAHRTPPYTPQHNVETAARILNMVPTKKVKKTPYEVLVELPPNSKTVGSKWLFKKKTDMDRVVHTYKAHLMEKGYTQTLGIDYEETFSLVVDIRAIWILIAIAAYYDYDIWKMDVKTAFLNRYLNEERYCMENSKRGSIPMQEKLKLSKSQGALTPVELKRMQNVPYASAIGSIIELRVSCYTDAGYLTDADDLKSQTGYVFILNGGAVDWKSAKQSIFATSSIEVEYITAFDASKEAVWVRKFIYRLGVVPTIEEPISMYCDNTIAIAIANESGITKGARHFHAKVHYLREVIEYGDVKLEKVHIDDNLADPFTKALAFLKHSKHTRNI